jgi:hypothetical protein
MKHVFFAMFLALSLSAYAQEAKTRATLKSTLLEQLRSTHNNKDWFVPANVAVDGMTAEQAKWTDGKGNHSVGMLTNHLVFWDTRALEDFKGVAHAKFNGNNDETFNNFDSKQWSELTKRLDQVMTDWENAVQAADDEKVAKWATMISNVSTHNAYHIGQIVIVSKEQGAWDPDKGVK